MREPIIGPKYVGYWEIGGDGKGSTYGTIRLAQLHKPRWLHRTMMRLLLGIVWHDGFNPEKMYE